MYLHIVCAKPPQCSWSDFQLTFYRFLEYTKANKYSRCFESSSAQARFQLRGSELGEESLSKKKEDLSFAEWHLDSTGAFLNALVENYRDVRVGVNGLPR